MLREDISISMEKEEESKKMEGEEDSEKIEKSLHDNTLQQNWDQVVKIYREHQEMHSTKITKKEDTALHVAVMHGPTETVLQLLDEIRKTQNAEETLSAKNKQGNTPLHCAASRGSKAVCMRMLDIASSLFHKRNDDGETPVFMAALHGHKEAFLYIHYFGLYRSKFSESNKLWRRKDGDSILHCTIRKEYFDLAFQIIHLYEGQTIITSLNESGITPLHILASKPSAFLRCTRFGFLTKILYYCIIVEPLEIDDPLRKDAIDDKLEPSPEDSREIGKKIIIAEDDLPKNYHTCHGFFVLFWRMVQKVAKSIFRVDWGSGQSGHTPVHHNRSFPPNYTTICDFIKSSYIYVLALSGSGLLSIKNMKERHVHCAQIMDELVEQHSEYDYMVDDDTDFSEAREGLDEVGAKIKKKVTDSSTGRITGGEQNEGVISIGYRVYPTCTIQLLSCNVTQQKETDKKMTALLTAAKNGVIDLVDRILHRIPMAIEDVDSEKKNIFLVAVEHRQPHIFQTLKDNEFYKSLIQEVDVRGNNVLHMAAHVSTYKPWKIPGAAMQMLWEIKWFQFVKENVPPHLIFQTNNDDKTPGEIFNESHRDLVKEGSEWLKSTSESCSVVAALIAGVSFATSSNVPGGNDEKTGKPTLEGHPAFDIFAITSLVALCFSVTALVMFLAILTSRHQLKDFRRDLPFKLLVGLSSLFVSIASILISFCAAHFFELEDKLTTTVFIIYAVTCLPVSFYAVAQFPLYLDLLRSILTNVPHPSYKEDDL